MFVIDKTGWPDSLHEVLDRIVTEELKEAYLGAAGLSEGLYFCKEDVKYNRKLKKALKRVLKHYMIKEDYERLIAEYP